MKAIRSIMLNTAVTIFLTAAFCLGQEIQITTLATSPGRLNFTLTPAGAVSDYSCVVEWKSTLSAGSWTNAWYAPFVVFPSSNGMFHADLPRFFRIRATEGYAASPVAVSYTVTGVVPSTLENGRIYWSGTGNSNAIYFVELSTGTNNLWLSQWANRTNLHAVATVTNSFAVPMVFRVVTIEDSGELPW